ncbi:MAG TPA: hypothetical protein VKW78_14450 [Terriglobales bacterium]|nr:hypothetical protein [Terriglobales bacterium]
MKELLIRRNQAKVSPGQLRKRRESGFTLVVCLLLMVLVTVMAGALLMMANTEVKVGGNDLNNNIAFHATEGALEKMTADLSGVFTTLQAPSCNQITNAIAAGQPPSTGLINYTEYQVTLSCNGAGALANNNCGPSGNQPCFGTIQSGPNAGLNAEIIPVTLSATTRVGQGSQVRMIRTAEVALIPVFQFGVFSESSLGFFNSPDLDFAGRIHTNGDLFVGVSNGSVLTFHQKITAYGNVVRQQLPNGLSSTTYGNTGSVYIASAANACDPYPSPSVPPGGSSCKSMSGVSSSSPYGDASVINGPTSAQSGVWPTTVKGKYNGWLIDGNYGNNGGTGASKLSLPFVSGGAQPFEILRRPPPAGDPPGSALSEQRLYNEAEIRVLLADDPAELPGGAADPQNVRLANVTNNGLNYSSGVPVGGVGNVYFAEASTSTPNINESNWTTVPTPDTGIACYPNCPLGAGTAPKLSANSWNLLDGYLRVEYQPAGGGLPIPVTQEWLQLGFARGVNPPTAASQNSVNPKAILILQQIADRDGNGALTVTVPGSTNTQGPSGCQSSNTYTPPSGYTSGQCTTSKTSCGGSKYYWTYTCTKPTVLGETYMDTGTNSIYTGAGTRNNWYPINFYDPREGEVRDNVTAQAAGSCAANGVMNAVEIDVQNLQKWLAGTIAGSGTSVDSATYNGYILYFSDHRGMITNNNPPIGPAPYKTGDAGLEDTINLASGTAGTPDGALEPPGGTASPEDDNDNGVLDNFGAKNMGLGFGLNAAINANAAKPNPYVRMANCFNTGRPNWVSGARHVLRLVDGSLGDVPTQPGGTGGFTVASDNPVYILGDYNSSAADPMWANPAGVEPAHAAASVIADAVTLMSNAWTNGGDVQVFRNPFSANARTAASTTYYRVAIAAGKNQTFPSPNWSQTSTLYGFGTDGGVHNFLRFVENWGGASLYYKGSLVSLYYSTYGTGTFKCCGDAVYHPPARHYVFDPLFAQPQNLPPGTPMFRDVDNLSYRQDLTPR